MTDYVPLSSKKKAVAAKRFLHTLSITFSQSLSVSGSVSKLDYIGLLSTSEMKSIKSVVYIFIHRKYC